LGDSTIGVAFFYCDGNYPEKQIIRNIIGSLSRQLLENIKGNRQTTMEYMKNLFHRHNDSGGRGPRNLPLDVSMSMLNVIAQCFSDVYLVVDGLDECMVRLELLEVLPKLAQGNVRILVSSRKEQDIAKEFREKQRMPMDPEAVKRDIVVYLESRLDNDPELKMMSTEMKGEVMETLISKNAGM
jgi:hypothetical protein